MTNVTPIDTRVSPTISREAALAAFPEDARTNPVAIALGNAADSVRQRLVRLADLFEAIERDTTLTDDARTLAAVKAAKQARGTVDADIKAMHATIDSAREALQRTFESELAQLNPGHGLSPGQALELALKRSDTHGGGFAGLNQVVKLAAGDRDGVSVLAVYRAPAWALGIDNDQRALLRDSIERTFSAPHVSAKQAFYSADRYIDRFASAATEVATPAAQDRAIAARAESNANARRAAEAAAGGEA